VRFAFIQPEHAFDEFKPDEDDEHETRDPPPRQVGKWSDFEIFQGCERCNYEDQWHDGLLSPKWLDILITILAEEQNRGAFTRPLQA
jgi:hypothetical protein